MPKWHEIRPSKRADTSKFTIHCKAVEAMDPSILGKLPSKDQAVLDEWRRAARWLADGSLYEAAKSDDVFKAKVSQEAIDLMLLRKKIEKTHGFEASCILFAIPEFHKDRFRMIQNCASVNATT